MPIKFHCPHCRKEYLVKDEYAGKKGKCSACSQSITIPTTSKVAPPPIGISSLTQNVIPPNTIPAVVEKAAVRGLIDIEAWRSPSETTAAMLLWFFAVPGFLVSLLFLFMMCFWIILIPFAWFFRWLGQWFALAYFKTNAVCVSSNQFPEINKFVEDYAARLNIRRPDVYVIQENFWNAFATKLAGRHIVVLNSYAVDSLILGGSIEDVAFLVGHELGHIAAGHLRWISTLRNFGAWFVWVALWHHRHTELTADNLALACCQDPTLATRALINMTVGGQLASRANISAILSQWNDHASEFFVRYRTLYSRYPHNLYRVFSLLEESRARGMYAKPSTSAL